MPLSEHEKRMLQEMEAALLTEDPRLFSALSGEIKPVRRSRTLVGLGLLLVGVVTLFGGLIAKVTPVGVLGFVISSRNTRNSNQKSRVVHVYPRDMPVAEPTRNTKQKDEEPKRCNPTRPR